LGCSCLYTSLLCRPRSVNVALSRRPLAGGRHCRTYRAVLTCLSHGGWQASRMGLVNLILSWRHTLSAHVACYRRGSWRNSTLLQSTRVLAGVSSQIILAGVDNLPAWPIADHTSCTGLGCQKDPFAIPAFASCDSWHNPSAAGLRPFSAFASSSPPAGFVPPRRGTCYASPSAEVHTANSYFVWSSTHQTHCRPKRGFGLGGLAAGHNGLHRLTATPP
jgi:hypothetical protein